MYLCFLIQTYNLLMQMNDVKRDDECLKSNLARTIIQDYHMRESTLLFSWFVCKKLKFFY